ncbi:MAG: hypothetical protein WC451_00510 [Patescibacteria group bacterium]
MALTKDDLKQIKQIVEFSTDDVTKNLSDKIDNTKQQIMNEMGERFKTVEKNINREISDLADINRAFMTRTDQIDHRLRIVERKLGLLAK